MKKIFLSPPHMGANERRYVDEVFESNYIAPLGAFVDRFEEAVCRYTGAPGALALSSGTAAIHLALRVGGVKRGDRVLASTFTFIGSVAPILYMGAEPVFVDSDESWNLSPALLEEAIEKERPAALVVTHLYGQSARIAEIAEICRRHGVLLVEDAAESLGALYEGKHTGTFGDFGVYSFNGNKIITTGGGGMLVSADEEALAHARKLSAQAREEAPWYEHEELGYNYRLSNVLAAIGVGQMEAIEERVAKKREIFAWYRELLAGVEEIGWMPEIPRSRGNRWLTTLTLERTDPLRVVARLAEEGIEARPLWKPMHRQPLFEEARFYGDGTSDALFAKGLCLPSGTAMTRREVERVVSVVKEALC